MSTVQCLLYGVSCLVLLSGVSCPNWVGGGTLVVYRTPFLCGGLDMGVHGLISSVQFMISSVFCPLSSVCCPVFLV